MYSILDVFFSTSLKEDVIWKQNLLKMHQCLKQTGVLPVVSIFP